jgi:hypothetical protein
MAVPPLNSTGFLPPGVFVCSIGEIRERFGTFQGNDHRSRLFDRLAQLVDAMTACRLFESLVIDGSFVSAVQTPNDIDAIAVLLPGHDFERDLSVSEYALVSRSMLRRRYGFDVIVAEQDSHLHKTYLEFFSRVRDNPEMRKGMLRLTL